MTVVFAINQAVRKVLFASIIFTSSFQVYAQQVATGILKDCLIVGVTDGDTIKARCGRPGEYQKLKVRLSAIDAPERKQAFGNRAREALSNIAYGKQADLVCNKKDRTNAMFAKSW